MSQQEQNSIQSYPHLRYAQMKVFFWVSNSNFSCMHAYGRHYMCTTASFTGYPMHPIPFDSVFHSAHTWALCNRYKAEGMALWLMSVIASSQLHPLATICPTHSQILDTPLSGVDLITNKHILVGWLIICSQSDVMQCHALKWTSQFPFVFMLRRDFATT